MSEHEGKWISTAEAAEIIGINRKAVAKAARKGKIKARRDKMGAWQVLADSVDEYRDGPRKIRTVYAPPPQGVTEAAVECKVVHDDSDNWLLRSVSLMTPDEAKNLARKVLEATVTDPAARLLIERYI